MGRRTLLLVAALLLAAIGTGVLFLFLRATATSQNGRSTSSGTTQVLAPVADVPAGTPIDGSVRFVAVTVSSDLAANVKMFPAGDPKVLQALRGRIASQYLNAGVPVTEAQFSGPVKESTDLKLDPGTMALTVEMSDPNRVGTFLRKGSRVAVFVVDPQAAGDAGHSARMILSPVIVLTTGSSGTIVPRSTATAGTGSSSGGRGSQALVTLQVTQDQAGKILVAQASGELYFTLLGPSAGATPRDYGPSDIAVRNLP